MHSHAGPRPPRPPWPQATLSLYGFDAPFWRWPAEPLAIGESTATLSDSWSGYALNRDSLSTLPVAIPGVSVNGKPEVAPGSGAIRFWYAANYTSANKQLGGAGPGHYAPLVEMVNLGAKTYGVKWSLGVEEGGNTIYLAQFGAKDMKTFLQAPVQFQAGQWRLLTLCYSPKATALYVDGAVIANGKGLDAPAPWEEKSLGIVLGSDLAMQLTAEGQFDELTTFDQWPKPDEEAFYFKGVSQVVALGPQGTPEEEAAKLQKIASAKSGMPLLAATVPTPLGGGGPYGHQGAYAYPSNTLWLEITTVTNGKANLIVHGTQPDVAYEILSRLALTNVPWASEGTILGVQGQVWTPTTVPVGTRTNALFLWARSWRDSDGSGLPDWWQLQYFGHLGVDPYADPDGDGWNNLQEYQIGTNPNSFNTPPPPHNIRARIDWFGNDVLMQWESGGGSIAKHILYRYNWNTYGYDVISQIQSPTNSFVDVGVVSTNLSANGISYGIVGVYSNNASTAFVTFSPEQWQLSPAMYLMYGPEGRMYAITDHLATGLTNIGFYLTGFGGDNHLFDFSPTNFLNGIALLPTNAFAGLYSGFDFPFAVGFYASGERSPAAWIYLPNDTEPFVDTSAFVKANLRFLLRAATISQPFGYVGGRGAWLHYPSPPAYEYWDADMNVPPQGLNITWKNFLWDSTNVTYSLNYGVVCDTGVYRDNYGIQQLAPPPNVCALDNPKFTWGGFPTNPPGVPPVMATNNSSWVFFDDLDLDGSRAASVGLSLGSGGLVSLASNARNVYGLPINSAQFLNSTNGSTTVGAGGSAYPGSITASFFQTDTPVLHTTDYAFWSRRTYYHQTGYALPGDVGFNPTNPLPPLVATVGNLYPLVGYAKQNILNGYTNKVTYLGQYFDKAYKMGANGLPAGQAAGVLNEYGFFLPTEPGPVLLTTKPDADQGGIQGTCLVHVVSLQLDVNHDGVMDLSFAGPDNTSAPKPFVFWVNNDCDWATYPGSPNFDPGSDKELTLRYSDQFLKDYLNFNPRSVRDLEDYARLWICGVPALTNGNYSVTLNWVNVSGSPAINLLKSVEPDGGTRYLTDANIVGTSNIVWRQIDGFIGGHKYNVPTTSTLTLPNAWFTNADNKYLLFEGAGIGSGELVLTISQNGTNVLARTSTWLDLRDVRDLYERVVVTNTTTGGITNWSSAIQTIEYPKVSMDDDTNIIVFVHGINNTVPNWLISSDTIFKRLYWAGYRGKFASLRWPCKYLPWNTFHPFDFNLSEFYGYKSGAALRDYLNQLRQVRFPNYQLHIYAHSQGGAVASDAISRYGAPFDTLVLSQAAMPASGYDIQAPTVPDLLTNELFEPTPQWQPMGYRGIYTNITGRVVNFFNTNDYALGIWVVDQKLSKPDGLPGARNYTSDGTNGYAIIDIGLYRLVTDSQECRGMVARSRTLAIGAQGPVSGQTTQGVVDEAIDLKTQFGFLDTRPEHSAQFTRPIQTVRPYYQQLLRSCQLQPAP